MPAGNKLCMHKQHDARSRRISDQLPKCGNRLFSSSNLNTPTSSRKGRRTLLSTGAVVSFADTVSLQSGNTGRGSSQITEPPPVCASSQGQPRPPAHRGTWRIGIDVGITASAPRNSPSTKRTKSQWPRSRYLCTVVAVSGGPAMDGFVESSPTVTVTIRLLALLLPAWSTELSITALSADLPMDPSRATPHPARRLQRSGCPAIRMRCPSRARSTLRGRT